MNLDNKKIAVIGLGYVGLPLSVEFGQSRFVLGFDIDEERIKQLVRMYDRTLEVEENKLRSAVGLNFTSDSKDLDGIDIFIVTVPTPIDKSNRPNLKPLIKASEIVGKAIKKNSIVIYESTVYPGCTEEICVPILEKESGMKYNEDFYCGYSPERINPGDKVNTITKIKKITSGSNPTVTDAIDKLYRQIITAGTYKASSIRVAEAAKVIENTQRDLNIALVNELSILFDRLNIDTLEVLEAASSKWNFIPYKPGMVGGHCIGVDPYYLTFKAEEVGYHPEVILAGRRIHDNMARYAARNVIKLMLKNGIDVPRSKVGIMGVTFKENCPDIRNTKVVDLINELKDWGVEVQVVDPYADPEEFFKEYQIRVTQNDLKDIDSLIIAVGHTVYRNMAISDLRNLCKSNLPVIADIKGLFDKKELLTAGFTVFRL